MVQGVIALGVNQLECLVLKRDRVKEVAFIGSVNGEGAGDAMNVQGWNEAIVGQDGSNVTDLIHADAMCAKYNLEIEVVKYRSSRVE